MPARGRSGPRETPQEARERRALVDDPQVVFDAAMRFLEVRQRSVDEVRRRLITAGYRTEFVEGAIARLTAVGLLNDPEFGRMWVRSRDGARPRSEQALRRELILKGLDRELIAEVLAERGGDEGASPDAGAAARLLAKRRGSLSRIAEPVERRRRAYALLARNGFDPDVCREAVAAFMRSDETAG